MQKNTLVMIAGSVLVLGLLFAGIFFSSGFPSFTSDSSQPVSASDANTSTTSENGGYVITQVPIDDWHTYMPSLDRVAQFSSSVPESARKVIQEKIDLFKNHLRENPNNVADWLDLAIWYHTANDYEGAKQVWEFLIRAIPNDTTSYMNLGKLYHFDLKDFPKAESHFLKVLTIAPDTMDPYLELHTLYRYSYKKEGTDAADILEKAAARFTENPDPLTLLGDYYRSLGKIDDARSAYTRALDRARSRNDISLIKSIGDELAKLPE